MSEEANWRDASVYNYISDLDPPGLAWEFLRRNAAYQDDYRRLLADAGMKAAERTAFVEKWGLSFRRRSNEKCRRGLARLVAKARPCRLRDYASANWLRRRHYRP